MGNMTADHVSFLPPWCLWQTDFFIFYIFFIYINYCHISYQGAIPRHGFLDIFLILSCHHFLLSFPYNPINITCRPFPLSLLSMICNSFLLHNSFLIYINIPFPLRMLRSFFFLSLLLSFTSLLSLPRVSSVFCAMSLSTLLSCLLLIGSIYSTTFPFFSYHILKAFLWILLLNHFSMPTYFFISYLYDTTILSRFCTIRILSFSYHYLIIVYHHRFFRFCSIFPCPVYSAFPLSLCFVRPLAPPIFIIFTVILIFLLHFNYH